MHRLIFFFKKSLKITEYIWTSGRSDEQQAWLPGVCIGFMDAWHKYRYLLTYLSLTHQNQYRDLEQFCFVFSIFLHTKPDLLENCVKNAPNNKHHKMFLWHWFSFLLKSTGFPAFCGVVMKRPSSQFCFIFVFNFIFNLYVLFISL